MQRGEGRGGKEWSLKKRMRPRKPARGAGNAVDGEVEAGVPLGVQVMVGGDGLGAAAGSGAAGGTGAGGAVGNMP